METKHQPVSSINQDIYLSEYTNVPHQAPAEPRKRQHGSAL